MNDQMLLESNSESRNSNLLVNLSIAKAVKLHGDKARVALKKEVQQMIDQDVFKFVRNSGCKPVIRSMLLMTEKRDTPGNLVKVKARLVAAGLTQQLKLWEDTASPTMRTEHLAVLLQLAVENRGGH